MAKESSKQVTVFTTETCVYCHAERKLLEEHGIPFKEARVDTDEAAAEEMIRLSGQFGVPFTLVKSDGLEEKIVGFDQKRLAGALNIG